MTVSSTLCCLLTPSLDAAAVCCQLCLALAEGTGGWPSSCLWSAFCGAPPVPVVCQVYLHSAGLANICLHHCHLVAGGKDANNYINSRNTFVLLLASNQTLEMRTLVTRSWNRSSLITGHRITGDQFTTVWLGGRVVRTMDLRSIGREFESWPLRYRVQIWASC